ncbi:MAG: hypothetical protein CMH60_06675 [Myxococcales bacterium]|nr:hypothetical protein [Myxococcales bacterium]
MIGLMTRLVPVGVATAAMAGGTDSMQDLQKAAMDIVYEVKVKQETKQIAQMIRLDIVSGGRAPKDLKAYIERNFRSEGGDPTTDPWQTPYAMIKERDGTVYVVSCGVDKRCGSDDDRKATVIGSKGF